MYSKSGKERTKRIKSLTVSKGGIRHLSKKIVDVNMIAVRACYLYDN